MGDLPLPVVHVLTDDDVLRESDFLARAAAVLAALGPRGALHIRGHHTSGRALYDIAINVAPLASRSGGMLVVNDRVDVALAAHAGGVQIGARSFQATDVRRIAPGLRVGESVHDVDSGARTRADWIIAGHVFATPSHEAVEPRGLEFVRAMAQRAPAPVIAVGGVRVEDVEALRSAGAYGVAVIRGVWHAVDNASAARAYLARLQ
jgi:thiazole tautomerase (transcriptional regulator TenI)